VATPYVSVAEVRQRVAAVVEALTGFRGVPWPMSPSAAPAGYDTHPFAVVTPKTTNTGRYRDNSGDGVRVRSDVRVEFLADVTPAEADELASLDTATNAEALVIRALLARGAAWTHDIVVAYVESDRGVSEDGSYLIVGAAFTVDHVLSLA